jgi:hypothetical protein
VRVAVSGSHGTGKSTLIAAFLERRRDYAYEPEAYEALADDVALTSEQRPTPEGIEALLQYTLTAVANHAPGTRVIFERSPVDYLAYAAASGRSWPSGAASDFLATYIPVVRPSLRHLDLIALLPVSRRGPIESRPDEDARFRKRVDERLRRALIDDDYDLFAEAAPRVVELSPFPERQLVELVRLTA